MSLATFSRIWLRPATASLLAVHKRAFTVRPVHNSPACLSRRAFSSAPMPMSVYDFLMQMEDDAEKFYDDLYNKAADPGFKKIFKMLADDKYKHKKWAKKLQETGELEDVAKTTVLQNPENVFQLMKAEGFDMLSEVTDQVGLYKAIKDIEEQSRDWFLDRALESRDPKVKRLFRMIADEEDKHVQVLSDLISFVDEQVVNQNPRWSG